MKTVPNQIVITVDKAKADKQHLYSTINLEAIDYAAIHLKSVGTFKLWLYIAKNQNQYEFALSRAAFLQWSGVSSGTYQSAVTELKNLHYLTPSPKQANKWIFHELPNVPKEVNKAEGDFFVEVPEDKKQELANTNRALKAFNF